MVRGPRQPGRLLSRWRVSSSIDLIASERLLFSSSSLHHVTSGGQVPSPLVTMAVLANIEEGWLIRLNKSQAQAYGQEVSCHGPRLQSKDMLSHFRGSPCYEARCTRDKWIIARHATYHGKLCVARDLGLGHPHHTAVLLLLLTTNHRALAPEDAA